MNKYIIPYYNISESKVSIHIVIARSLENCKEKLITMYEDQSDSNDWGEFIDDLYDQGIILGKIIDIEEL